MATYTETTDHPAFFNQIVVLQDGDRFEGQLDGDTDWIAAELSNNYSYIIRYEQNFDRPFVTVFNGSGTEVSSVESGIQGNLITSVTPNSDDIYYIEAYDHWGATGPYVVTVTSEIADTVNTMAAMPFDLTQEIIGTFNGVFEHAQDTDYIAVQLDAGYTYVFQTATNSPEQLYFSLKDSDGDTVERDSPAYSVASTGYSYTVQESGTYYLAPTVDVNNPRPTPLTDALYQITAYVEPPANGNTAYSLEVGETASGQWDNHNDYDFFEVQLEAGTSYIVSTQAGELTYLYFSQANGERIEATSLNFSGGDFEAVTPTESGTYYIAAGPYSGAYTIGLSSEVAGDITTTESLTVGNTKTSQLNYYRDVDVYAVNLTNGLRYDVSVDLANDATSGASLAILDSTGEVIWNSASSRNAIETVFEAPSTGTFYIQVTQSGGIETVSNYDVSVGRLGKIEDGTLGNDTLVGTDFVDTLTGAAGDDVLKGNGGNDVLQGGPGNDLLQGFAGNDLIKGGGHDDTLAGGSGNDTLIGIWGHDLLLGKDGDDLLNGGAGHDSVYGGNHDDTLLGQAGSDLLAGGNGRDLLRGGKGNDTILGGGGHDDLHGGKGADILRGGGGDDTISGKAGRDTLTGGSGSDTFVFTKNGGFDTVVDFGKGNDVLRIDPALLDPGVISGGDVIDSYASVVTDGVMLNFGGGDKILLEGLTSLNGLSDQFELA